MQEITDDPALAAAIAAIPEWRDRQVGVTPITTGITNRNFLIEAGDEAFVLRLAGKDTDVLGIDREAEREAGGAAFAAGVGPEIYAWLPHHQCLITRFVHGSPISTDDLRLEPVLTSLVGSVRALHSCPPIIAEFPVFRIVEDYHRVAIERGVPIPDGYAEARAVATEVETSFAETPMAQVPCHNDLLNANFLLDGDHVWIVDYEYAGMGDPFFDLGNLSINNGLTPAAIETLLRLYFGTVRDVHRARLNLMQLMSDFREAMWGLVQRGISDLEVDYEAYAVTHLQRLLTNANDRRFVDWLAAARYSVHA